MKYQRSPLKSLQEIYEVTLRLRPLSAWTTSNPDLQMAVYCFMSQLYSIQQEWKILKCIKLRHSYLLICVLAIPPKNQLHVWKEKWWFKIVTIKADRENWSSIHVHGPRISRVVELNISNRVWSHGLTKLYTCGRTTHLSKRGGNGFGADRASRTSQGPFEHSITEHAQRQGVIQVLGRRIKVTRAQLDKTCGKTRRLNGSLENEERKKTYNARSYWRAGDSTLNEGRLSRLRPVDS
jgi:hypothetical protein